MRENPATTLGKYKVVEFRDYKKDIIKNNATGETTKTGLPIQMFYIMDLKTMLGAVYVLLEQSQRLNSIWV